MMLLSFCWIAHFPLIPPETQGDPFIHSHHLVSEVSKFAVNFILRQSIFSQSLKSPSLFPTGFYVTFHFPRPVVHILSGQFLH